MQPRQPRTDPRRDAEAITPDIGAARSTSRDPQAAASLGGSRHSGAGAQISQGTTADAARLVPPAGNDGQQYQAVTPAPTGLAFPEQAKLHEALRQPPPSLAAAPVSTPSEAPAPVPEIAKLDATAPVPGITKLDEAAAAAQADLASPLPTLVPTDQPPVPARKIKTERQRQTRRLAPMFRS